MQYLHVYSNEQIKALTRNRSGETKIGEKVRTISGELNLSEQLTSIPSQFVLLGLPEDIGVRANYGRGGAHTAWQPALENILNMQHNNFLNGEDILVLGHINFTDLMQEAYVINMKDTQGLSELRNLVEKVDERVANVIELIIGHKKTPIIIGGGHNNAYPNIKGSFNALKKLNTQAVLNIINCDPHTDFRPIEGRHSGNGFSYAYNEKMLSKYAVIAIHEQYNTHNVLTKFKENKHTLFYNTYEDIFIREAITFNKALMEGISFCSDSFCGVEIDLDAITNVPSSAKTSSGISHWQARQYVYNCAKELNAVYLHIAEGAPILAHIKADNKTGKLIAYLVADFIKGANEKR